MKREQHFRITTLAFFVLKTGNNASIPNIDPADSIARARVDKSSAIFIIMFNTYYLAFPPQMSIHHNSHGKKKVAAPPSGVLETPIAEEA